tara:strand:+ start:78261 stop:79436 length:1176 start_codon:yes stop_codon:yes gene_type:complete
MFKNLIPVAMLLISSFATAQEVYWKKQTVSLPVAGSASKGTYAQSFQRVVLQHNYYECGFPVEPTVQVVQGTCYDTTCSGGAGKSPLWDAFYSARKEEKPSRLAAAIKGVGQASADPLVAGGYFNSKPKSWNAFKSVINSAAANGAITQQVKTLVLSNYRNENMANLGYAGGCTSTPYTCDEVHVIQEGYYVQRTCDAPVEQPIESRQVSFEFNVENSILLPSETENIELSVSPEAGEISMKEAYYNKYAIQAQQTGPNHIVVSIDGAARKQVPLPKGSLQSVSLTATGATTADLQVSVSPAILPVAQGEQLVIKYEVKSCKIGFFPCITWDKKETFTKLATGPTTTIPVSSPLVGKKGLKMQVDVEVYKSNSIYHNAKPLSKDTESIKLK